MMLVDQISWKMLNSLCTVLNIKQELQCTFKTEVSIFSSDLELIVLHASGRMTPMINSW